MKRFLSITALVLASQLYTTVAAAEIVGEHGVWTAYREKGSDGAICFISSQPTKDQGNYKKRGDIFAIVSHSPQQNRLNEVSFQAGYDYKKGLDVTATIDGKQIAKLFTREDTAWTYDKKSDATLVAAMRAGTTMVVKGTSSRGTITTDTYSLKGFTAALRASKKACGIK